MRSLVTAAGALAGLASTVLALPNVPVNEYGVPLVRRQEAQGPDTPLYLNSPSCDFYQCTINITYGDTIPINWLNAPEGDVSIDLVRNPGGDLAYHIATVPGTSEPGYCDAGFGLGTVVKGTTCGAYNFILPHTYAPGNYSFSITSESNKSLQSYTDVVLIFDNLTRTNPSAQFSAVPVSGAPTATTTSGSNFAPTPSPTAPLSPGAPAPSGAPSSAPSSGRTTAPSDSSGHTAASASSSPAPGSAHASSTTSESHSAAASRSSTGLALPALAGGAIAGVLLLF